MEVETAWVKPPPQVGGLDHLAVQAPCINVYGRLLPGITNVTDRARYYSFYPWLIWTFDKQGFTTYDDEFVERFRRADCLFTLISERHAAVVGSDYDDHAAAMVGSDTLRGVSAGLAEGDRVRLSDYSLREGAKTRYFKNKLGGLGQYYLGVLRELAVLDGDASQGIKYTRQIGQLIAEQVDAGFDGDLFLSVVESNSVTTEQLDALSALCPCQLASNAAEQEILGKLFFARESFYDPEALPRRRTLQSVLQLAGLLDDQEHELTESTFRACAYCGALPNGDPWPVPDSLVGNREKWAVYSRNEVLSVAVQGLFCSLLDAYQESALRFESSRAVVDWFVNQGAVQDALDEFGVDQPFDNCVATASTWLPQFNQWTEPLHEAQLVESIVRMSKKGKATENRRTILIASLRTMVALAGRTQSDGAAYADLVFQEGYFQYYPINLKSFEYHRSNSWPSMTMRDVLRWMLLNWGIELHLRVALRKLRGQSKSTFRIRPSDRGLEVTNVPEAVHTQPRFKQAMRILKDVGALEKSDSGRWRPSKFGNAMLELGDAP